MLGEAIEKHIKAYVEYKTTTANYDLITDFKINKYKVKKIRERENGDEKKILFEYVSEVTLFYKDKDENVYLGGIIKSSEKEKNIRYEFSVDAIHINKSYNFTGFSYINEL